MKAGRREGMLSLSVSYASQSWIVGPFLHRGGTCLYRREFSAGVCECGPRDYEFQIGVLSPYPHPKNAAEVHLHRPSPTALRARARTLVEQMSERARWIYALPLDTGAKHLAPTLAAHGFALRSDDGAGHPLEQSDGRAEGKAAANRWTNAGETAAFVVLARDDLEVLLVEAQGADAAAPLGALLAKAGFFAQSALLASAFDVATEDARKAMLTLAHMVVAWDDDWADLFLLQLASPDPIVRRDAVTALAIAALVARDKGPSAELLAGAAKRETFPQLKEAIAEARALVEAIAAPS
jgi:hypothetical protein